MKRVIFSVLAGAVVVWLFWVGGFDFDRRGEAALWVSMLVLFATAATYSYPWED